jgi:hypothetical protein
MKKNYFPYCNVQFFFAWELNYSPDWKLNIPIFTEPWGSWQDGEVYDVLNAKSIH